MKNGLTLMEEHFCNLIAIGHTAREAYSESFSIQPTTPKLQHSVDNKASRLMRRPDIVARISEAAGEQKRRNQEKWKNRGEDLAERIYARVVAADEDGKLLTVGPLKGVEVLARLKGLNAPDETVLKDGGRSDNYTPRGIEAMSDEDLQKIAARTIDIDTKEGAE